MAESSRHFLCSHGWLATVPPAFREAIFAIGRLREISSGETFNIAGDTNVGIWGLVSGQVAIVSAMNNPDAPIALIGNPGHWGGLAPLFGQPRLANVTARVPSVILFVPYQALRQMLDATPVWWEHVGMLAYEHVMSYGQIIGDLMLQDTRARMASILLHQAGIRNTGDGPVTLAFTQEELGRMANLSRQPAGQILREFEALDMIHLGYRQIIVLQPNALRGLINVY